MSASRKPLRFYLTESDMARKIGIIIILVLALTAIFLERSRFWHSEQGHPQGAPVNQALDYTMHVLGNNSVSTQPVVLPKGVVPVAGVTSHHLPTAENFINNFYYQLSSARPDITEFVIVGPDHFERCGSLASATNRDFLTPFGELKNNQEITAALVGAGAGQESQCFENEHSIGVHTTFIKKYFPNASVSPIIFSSAATMGMADTLAQAVYKQFPNAVVIASIDFSHYQPASVANQIDNRTQKQIENMNINNVALEQMDSPASLRMATSYALLQSATPELINHANSFDFTGNPDNTTGYFNVIFAK